MGHSRQSPEPIIEPTPPFPIYESSLKTELLTYKEAAQYLGLSEPYLRRLKTKGILPYVCIGIRAVRFRVASLNRWIEEREVK